MRLYTVLAVHDAHGTVSWHHIEGKTALDAMTKLAKTAKGSSELQIVAALAGKHEFETPGQEEHFRSAYASDLAQI